MTFESTVSCYRLRLGPLTVVWVKRAERELQRLERQAEGELSAQREAIARRKGTTVRALGGETPELTIKDVLDAAQQVTPQRRRTDGPCRHLLLVPAGPGASGMKCARCGKAGRTVAEIDDRVAVEQITGATLE